MCNAAMLRNQLSCDKPIIDFFFSIQSLSESTNYAQAAILISLKKAPIKKIGAPHFCLFPRKYVEISESL